MTRQVVPLAPVPSQSLSIVLGGQNCAIKVFTLATGTYLDLEANDVPIRRGVICRNRARLLVGREYRGFRGDLRFIDTQGDADPHYAGFGSRWLLIYDPT